jgi:hypothetical protein
MTVASEQSTPLKKAAEMFRLYREQVGFEVDWPKKIEAQLREAGLSEKEIQTRLQDPKFMKEETEKFKAQRQKDLPAFRALAGIKESPLPVTEDIEEVMGKKKKKSRRGIRRGRGRGKE